MRLIAFAATLALVPSAVIAQGGTAAAAPRMRANWELAEKFNPDAMRRVTYSASVAPRFIGKTDSLWYNWRDQGGTRFMLAFPPQKVKQPLFDHVKLAAALATAHRKPYESNKLPFTTLNFTKDHKAFRFTVDTVRYEWSLAAETLRSLGRPPHADSLPADEERGEGGGGGGVFGFPNADFRNWSPDSTAFVFARDHNLYLVEKGKTDTLKISTDGEKNHSFGFRDTTQTQQQDDSTQNVGGQGRNRDPRVRANVTWSADSRAFAITRNDARKVKELYLVNSLSTPRPTLMSYSYAMPGEADVAQQELYYYRRGEPAVKPLNVSKWRDQRILSQHWPSGSDRLRLVRRDRLQRNLELVEIDLATGAIKSLITESVENANLEQQAPRYTKTGGDIIWWSERSGWGHYYLYDHNGTYKKPLTSGAWRADQIAQIDTIGGVIFLSGVGREPGENVYHRHLYRVNADGSGLALLDAGDAEHQAVLSPTRKYFVDNFSRVDVPNKTVVRDALGKVVMDLEAMDLAQLKSMGWRPPTPFVVKAADGTTDIYGNMWKPFDFDSTRKYPIIASVYPGPQTEQVNVGFNPGGVQQQLAQMGFIVIQIGNRGGHPLRSNAYQNFSYFNLRDYALADKKAGIEQLAARHAWIDIDKVGIYGHSGGGFLTGAALLLPPYNDFFKVGVSSAGNHDNNIYNQNWSEQYHGLREVPVRADSGRSRTAATATGRAPVSDVAPAGDSTRFQIKVPTNAELAGNLKGRLLLVHGDMDNNVHPGGTIRLAEALIKANKRFDLMIMPGKAHGFGDMQPYFTRMLMEYFSEHLLGDYYRGGAIIR